MITVITRWDHTQMSCDVEFQMWRQLKHAFDIDRLIFVPGMPNSFHAETFDTMEEALADVQGHRVFLEPTGACELRDIPTGDLVFIVGNTAENNLAYAQETECFHIKTGDTYGHLYGVNAVAVALGIQYN